MKHYKVALLDADGVAITPPRPYSHEHAEVHDLNPEQFGEFFAGDFQDALRGKADLKDLITKYSALWQAQGDPQTILDKWFAYENHPNSQLIELIQQLRKSGLPCYLATDQEKYRYNYLATTIFPHTFDGIFASCNLGATKREPEYFRQIIAQLQTKMPGLNPNQIIYFDDSEKNITTAASTGIDVQLYKNPEQVRELLF